MYIKFSQLKRHFDELEQLNCNMKITVVGLDTEIYTDKTMRKTMPRWLMNFL